MATLVPTFSTLETAASAFEDAVARKNPALAIAIFPQVSMYYGFLVDDGTVTGDQNARYASVVASYNLLTQSNGLKIPYTSIVVPWIGVVAIVGFIGVAWYVTSKRRGR